MTAAHIQTLVATLQGVGLDLAGTRPEKTDDAVVTVLQFLRMPGNAGTNRLSTGSSTASLRSVSTAALTSTTPASSSPRSAASRRTSEPPIDRPAATTASFSAASLSKACSTVAIQSAQVTRFMSCQRVPWPGSSGISTAYPRPARSSAHGRIDAGLPVNPCTTSTPTRLPPVFSGCAGADIGATSAGSIGAEAGRNGIFTRTVCTNPPRWLRCERNEPRNHSPSTVNS